MVSAGLASQLMGYFGECKNKPYDKTPHLKRFFYSLHQSPSERSSSSTRRCFLVGRPVPASRVA